MGPSQCLNMRKSCRNKKINCVFNVISDAYYCTNITNRNPGDIEKKSTPVSIVILRVTLFFLFHINYE